MKHRLFVLILFLAFALSLISPLVVNAPLGSTAAAATIPSDATLQKQGEANGACAVFSGNDRIMCGTFYKYGFKNPDKSKNEGCAGDGIFDSGIFSDECVVGFPAGTAARKAFDKDASSPKPTGNLTTAQIEALARTSTECSKYADGVGANMESCIKGYVGGYKGQNKDTVCDSHNVVFPKNCERGYDEGKSDKAAGVKTQTQQQAKSAVSASTVTGDNSNIDKLSCDYSSSKISWIICPFVDAMVAFVGAADSIITQQLSVDTNDIFCDNSDYSDGTNDPKTCAAYYKAWQTFRNIALGLMVVAGLIILISQALGLELLDAYTLRKTLPRLLIAAVGITLSWPLMQFAITLTNDLGYGIRNLIYEPFNTLHDEIKFTFSGGAGAAFLAGGAITAFGIFGLLSYAVTAALAVLVAILVLVIRQIAITVMLILSPIAIVCYILPNTQRVYKLWWESFSKALLMFPLIAAFIAAGRVFSAIALQGGPVSQMIGFVAYFAPYFLIPLTFKMAGSFMGQIGGFVNDRSRGGFDRLSKFRAGQATKNAAALKAGSRYKGTKYVPGSRSAARRFGETTKGLGTGWNGRFGMFERGRVARRMVDQTAAAEAGQTEGMKSVSGWNDVNRVLAASMGDEKAGREALYRHLMDGGDDGSFGEGMTDAEKHAAATLKVDQAARAAKVAGGFTKANGIAAFTNMARDGTAIRDVDDLAELAATVGQGDKNNTFKYAAEAASISRQVGRSDLAAASEPIGALAFSYSDQKYKRGAFSEGTAKAGIGDPGADHAKLREAAWISGAGGESMYVLMSNAKGRTVRNNTRGAVEIVRRHQEEVKKGIKPTQDLGKVKEAAAMLLETKQAVQDGHGRYNNRRDAQRELEKLGLGDGTNALDGFLAAPVEGVGTAVVRPSVPKTNPDGSIQHNDQGQPMYESRVDERTIGDEVRAMAAQRGANLNDDQRKAAAGGGTPDEEK